MILHYWIYVNSFMFNQASHQFMQTTNYEHFSGDNQD